MWLLDQALSIDSLRNDALEATMGELGGSSPYVVVGVMTRAMAIRNINNLCMSYYLDSTSYSPMEYADDVYARVLRRPRRAVRISLPQRSICRSSMSATSLRIRRIL